MRFVSKELSTAFTVDVEVAETHSYQLSNGLVSHNTVSLLTGATPGIHYPHSEYYIRHVRVANTSPLVELVKAAGYQVHADPYADDTSVVAFPVHEEHFVKGKAEVSLWEQFVNTADLQRHWADNAVSVTITFNRREASDIRACLEAFEDKIKAVTLLPLRDEDHQYKFAPYQTITRKEYEQLMADITPMDLGNSVHEVTEAFCTSDRCMIPQLP